MRLTIDGSFGEGGGQILRTAIALSAILQKGVHVTDIRKNRPHPGLGAQHVKSIEIARDMTGAIVEGLYPGSTEVTFDPGPVRAGDYVINIGTAGSITLALQSILPIAAYAPGPVMIDITGGTDVRWSPPYDYFKSITIPALARFGYHISVSLIRRGYFPVGDGRVIVHATPADLRGADFMRPYDGLVTGVSASSRLPSHVSMRQAKSAENYLMSRSIGTGEIELDIRNDPSTGSSITLFKGCLGGSSLGERGKPAEKVGEQAASILSDELTAGAAVDAHLADQLIIYMALARGPSSILTSAVTNHTLTGIYVVENMTGKKFDVLKNDLTVIRS